MGDFYLYQRNLCEMKNRREDVIRLPHPLPHPHMEHREVPSGLWLIGSDFTVQPDDEPKRTSVTLSQSLSSDVTSTTSAPSPPLPPSVPERGSYNITNNGTVCLLASMGLQLNITYNSRSQGKAVQETINLQPNLTRTSGSCEADNSKLVLLEGNTNLTFTFFLNSTTNKYHLSELALSINLPDMAQPLIITNHNLSYLQGTLGYSYMCRQELILAIEPNFSLNTFHLQVQPFGVSGNEFGAAEECDMDKDDMLIPIAVGAALAGLVLVVFLAYLIGRKRSHAGYQTI
ncbi:lysosomal-associated membrane protein 1 precursor [Silurus asotus]|uniref:Lysosomal-associated membrane protein 1 n=1 Tax=Silurus asotus TaxID=30991 RepID=A0AAD5ARX6_SILAS|nr:lysosomal-associated membrane protein 1 precursor [Silurus asotus]